MKNNKNVELENQFKKLQKFVFNGNSKLINLWFIENKDIPSLEKELIKYINNESYFFNFASPISMRVKEHTIELNKRKNNILKNLNLDNQLALMNTITFDSVDINNIKELKIKEDKNSLEKIKKSEVIFLTITTLFSNDKFTEIEEIEKYLNLNLLENQQNFFPLYKVESGSISCTYFRNLKQTVSPYYDIIYSFNKNKAQYLEKREIPLISNDIIHNLNEELILKIKKDYPLEYLGKIETYNEYEKYNLHIELSKNLKNENVSKKTNKI